MGWTRIILVFIFLTGILSPLNVRASEIFSPWINTASLDYTYVNNQTVVFKNHIYLFGGTAIQGSTRSNVRSSAINSNGSLLPWKVQSPMPRSLIWHALVLIGNRVYIVGGMEEPPQMSTNAVSFAEIDQLGNISFWSDSSNVLPKKLSLGSVVKTENWVYYLGGATWPGPTLSNNIYKAVINQDNSIGEWTNANIDLPTPLAAHGSVVKGNKIYIIGGSTDSNFIGTNKIYVFGSDPNTGNLTRLPDADNLPFGSRSAMITRIGDYIIHAGGIGQESPSTNKVFFAKIDSTDNIGPWELSSNALPQINCCTAIASWGSYIYITGGHDGSGPYYNSVVYTHLEPPPPPSPASIVVIPGMGASWNADALLNCKDENYAGSWETAPFAQDVYSPLLKSLSGSEHKVITFNYDWRKDVRDHLSYLNDLIQSEPSNSYLIGHSMGGLIGRVYLETKRENSKLDKLFTVGSPHLGSVLAYPTWSSGKIWGGNLSTRIALTILLNRCGGDRHEAIVNHIPSIQNLLPTFNYLFNKQTEKFVSISTMNARNTIYPINLTPPFFGTEIGTLSGNGKATLYQVDVKNPSSRDDRLGIWIDGKPIRRHTNRLGDGTVLTSSSQLDGALNLISENENHVQIIKSARSVGQILNFFGISTEAMLPKPEEEFNSALVILSPDAEIKFEGDNNIRSAEGISVILNPRKKDYRFVARGQKARSQLIVAQFMSDESSTWHEYNLPKGLYRGTLNFNPQIINYKIFKL